MHKYRCSLLGIRDPETVDELWQKAEAERVAKEPPKPKRRRP